MFLSVMKRKEIYIPAIIRNICYLQIGIGISASTFLICLLIFMVLQDGRVKPVELIMCHLALVHIVMLLITLDFVSPDMFVSLNLQNDFKCKALFYLSRVMRGLSICTTCFLSLLQATTISPNTDWMIKTKHVLTNYIIHIFLFFWSLNLSFSSYIILFTEAYSNMSQTNLLISEYCSISPVKSIMRRLFFVLEFSRDVFFVALMLFSSAYMVLLLLRHHRQSLHLHRSSLSARHCPEQRATWTVLVLVSVFVVTYWMNLIVSSRSTLLWRYDPVLLNLQKLVLNAYATVCPVIQMTFQKRTHDIVQLMYWKYCHC